MSCALEQEVHPIPLRQRGLRRRIIAVDPAGDLLLHGVGVAGVWSAFEGLPLLIRDVEAWDQAVVAHEETQGLVLRYRAFPGNGQGTWTATVDYKGKPKFGGQVQLLDGNFDLLFADGKSVLGRVTGGTITWPAAGQSTVCGTEVAVVTMNVRYRVGATGRGFFEAACMICRLAVLSRLRFGAS